MKKQKKELKNFWMKNRLLIVITILVILFVYDNYMHNGVTKMIAQGNAESLKSYILSFGVFAPIIFASFVILQVVFAPIPGILLAIVGGLLFGPFLASTIVWVSVVIGSVICFYIAKNLGREFILSLMKKAELGRFDILSQRYGFWILLFLRLNPITNSDLLSYAAGLSKINFKDFFWATVIGSLPLSYLGVYLSKFIKGEALIKFVFIISSVFIALFIIYIFYTLSKTKLPKKRKIKK